MSCILKQNGMGNHWHSSGVIKMQLDMTHWEGDIELLLEGLDGQVNPWVVACEYGLDDSSNEAIAKIVMDCGWEILDANCTFNPVLAHIGMG